ncbi:MAG: hemolysin III family protein [Acidobacteria bacterium]|nr:hemolysin III family protein [Acidobacteriota bacterium]
MRDETPKTSFAEEFANSVTHGVGLGLSVAGLTVLIILTALRGTAWHVVSCTIYGSTLVILYAASTLYHSIQSPRAKRVLRIIDHGAIYLLIAGTYTPFTLVNLRGGLGWTLFGVVWGLALLGILFKVFHVDRFPIASTLVYLSMGWLVVVAWKPVVTLIPVGGIALIAAGGAAYTIGVFFFAAKRIPYNHAIWHLFVLAGSIFHYVAVLLYVLPARNGG